METTTALTVTGPDEAQLQQIPVPTPEPGSSLVDVAAVGVNFIDVYQRSGIYPIPTPFVLGSEGAGTVRGSGRRVAWPQYLGSATGVAAVPDRLLVDVPDGVDTEVAAAIMLQGLTAHYLVTSTHRIVAGDVALVHAAAGGVGRLLVQMITARGGTVIATAGSPQKCQIAKDLGAAAAIDYTATDDLAAAVRDAAGGGVDVAYDGVGRSTFEASLASLRPRGLLALFGGASGQVPPFDLQRLNAAGSLFVTRPSLGAYIADRDELLWRSGEVLGDVAAGTLQVHIGGRYALAEFADAYADLEGRRSTGKLILIP